MNSIYALRSDESESQVRLGIREAITEAAYFQKVMQAFQDLAKAPIPPPLLPLSPPPKHFYPNDVAQPLVAPNASYVRFHELGVSHS